MVNGATATTTTTTATPANDVRQLPEPDFRQSWPCSSCHVSFEDGQVQREHMKSPWHVYNLKRRIASLPPISLEVFHTQVQPQPEVADEELPAETHLHVEDDQASPYHCLFCHQTFDNHERGLQDNLAHMSLDHGLFIPDVAMVLNLESFMTYLSTIIREWHECLYCGVIRDSTTAVQSHMRDKGHCKLNFDREPELQEFWDEPSEIPEIIPAAASNKELVLPLGRRAAPKAAQQHRANTARSKAMAVAAQAGKSSRSVTQLLRERPCRQLSRRDEMGLQSLGPQQRQALVLATKRSQKEEATASRASEWSYAKKANKQKHDQAHGPLSWAKGGLHNLLPR